MTTKSATILLIFLPSILLVSAQERRSPAASQAPAAGQAPSSGSLRQIIPGHYVYSTNNAGRLFNSGVIVTSEGAVVVDALGSEAIARAERASISSIIKQPVRYLVSSPFHDQFSKGNIAYADVFKVGHENYRAGLLDQMERGGASAEEQRARLPNLTFRDRATFYVGGKEIQVLYFGRAHTLGDSIVFVPQDRIAYVSKVFFSEEFPSRMRQVLVDARDAIQNEIARGATEDQAVAAVKLEQYAKLPSYPAQREVVVRRMYKELTGNLP